jgi:hypothetical protein
MAEVPTWEALFARSLGEDIDEAAVRATLATIRTEEGEGDG